MRGERTTVEEDVGRGNDDPAQDVAKGVPAVLGSSSRGRTVLREAGMKALEKGNCQAGWGKIGSRLYRELSKWKRR